MTTALSLRDVRVDRGGLTILRSVSFDVAFGELCVLMGVSGAGKSTALRAIAALEAITAGTITIGDVTLEAGALPAQSRLRGLRRQVGLVLQAPSLFEHMTALENVTLAPVHTLGWSREHAVQVAHDLLDSLGVAARAGAYPRQLSGGEAQRVAIARSLALGPKLLLMDEPTSALDPARRVALGASLRALARGGRGLLVATHDLEFARAHADRVVILDHGHIVEQGATDVVLWKKGLPMSAGPREAL